MNVAIVNLATGQSHTMAPLGALYIVAALEQAGAAVTFKDYALERGPDLLSCDRIARFCLSAAPDATLLGVSCFAGMLPYAVEACRRVRDVRPDLRIVLGGPGPSATPAAILDAFPAIDFVAFGEGETTAIELLDALAATASLDEHHLSLGKIDGLAWRDPGGRAIVNAARQRRRDLDDIPFPAYHHVPLAAYDVVGVVTTRGCPYACTYCDVVSMWKRRSIARSVDNVIAEIEWLHAAFGVRHVACVDDLFTVDRRRTLENLGCARAHRAARHVGVHDAGGSDRRRAVDADGGCGLPVRVLRGRVRIGESARARQQGRPLRPHLPRRSPRRRGRDVTSMRRSCGDSRSKTCRTSSRRSDSAACWKRWARTYSTRSPLPCRRPRSVTSSAIACGSTAWSTRPSSPRGG